MDLKNILWDAADFESNPPEKSPEIIQGLAGLGEVISITGGSKSFKSFAMLDLAAQCAGLPSGSWMGRTTFQAKVLYCNFELKNYVLADRMKMIRQSKGIPPLAKGQLKVLNFRNKKVCRLEFLKIAKEIALESGSKLIIVDPLYMLYDSSSNENDAGAMTSMLQSFGCVAEECQAVLAYVHHQSKGDQSQKFAQDRGSGSGAFRRHADSLIAITEVENPRNDDRHYCVDFEVRNYPPIQPIGIQWTYPCFSLCPEANLAKIKSPTKKRSYKDSDFLALLKPEGSSYSEWFTACSVKFDVSESSFNRASKRIIASGKASKQSDRYFPS